jgi:predicted hydrocarbon binding protein
MAQIKGFALRGLLKYVKTVRPGGIPAVLAKLPPSVAPTFKNPIVASVWYPYESFAALLDTIDRELGRGDLALMSEIGRRSALEDSGTVFRILATIASVETIIKRSPIFWQKYCDTGRIDPLDVGHGIFRVALKEFPGISKAQCNVICGWIEGMAKATGAKNVTVKQTGCVHRGDPFCLYEGTY